MVLEYLKLFATFAKIGMFTIGGGYAMIPLIEREIVAKQWMSKEEFMEMFALTQSLPGEIALTYVYGIGRSSSAKILDKAGVDKDLKVKDWTDDQAAKIREIIGAEYKVEGDLRSEVQLNIKRLMDIGCYRGVRHRIGLPVRGQSTKNNARTRKGRKKTVANKKKATK